MFVSVALICFVLYLRKIVLSKQIILYCLVSLNSVLFKPCLVSIHFRSPTCFRSRSSLLKVKNTFFRR